MNDSDPTDPEREAIALLRADFAIPEREVQTRVSNRLALGIGTLALAVAAPRTAPRWTSALRGQSLRYAISFALGGGCGAGLFAVLQRPPAPERVYVDRPVAQAAPMAAVSAEPQSTVAPQPSTSVAAKPPATGSASRGPAGLAEQQALLDVARSAFGRNDYPQTLAVLSAHAQRFPKSVLTEEREALEIKALAASGRVAEAKARAARFAAHFPQSLLLPSIADNLKAIP
jgi:TolA-binding protein